MTIDLAVIPVESVRPYHQGRINRPDRVKVSESLSLMLYIPGSLKRHAVELFIHQRYLDKHDARIRHFMPYLISLETGDRNVVAAAGFRPATDGELFLEKYLNLPVEQVLGEALGLCISREVLVEVGNFATDGGHSSRLMIMAMAALFHQQGFSWVTMTGTRELVNILKRMRLEPVELIDADADCLGTEKNYWGSYYEHYPRVMCGNILKSHNLMLATAEYHRFISTLKLVSLAQPERKTSV